MRVVRGIAAFLPALIVVLTTMLVVPATAQPAPMAAPTGAPADTAPLAAPTSNVDVNRSGTQVGMSSRGISIVDLFLRADPLVKGVFIVLVLASFWSWVIIINKGLALSTLARRAAKFEKQFWSGQSLDELFSQFAARNDHPFVAVFVSGLREWRRGFEHGAPSFALLAGVKDRVEKSMNVTISRETDAIEKSVNFLATVASTSPFVGLFGTVWGIMNSFSAIAGQHNTSLAVVAPGISEALFATAMCLLAAIPAAIFYNRFVNEIGRYSNRLYAFADELSAILSRQLDEKAR
jgi:biopolymer transport protein TolQ